MLDAALAYTAHGIPVFPVDAVTKAPIPKRDRDPVTGKKIAGTGGCKKATTNPEQIRKWWKNREHQIAVPTGKRIGAWVLDIDAPEDHEDGIAGWNKVAAEHDPIETREHRSATGGPHLFFERQEGIACSKGSLPPGISVKGEGGYVLFPPSIRKGRSYTVHNDIHPAPTPQWLLDRIKAQKKSASGDYNGKSSFVGLEELADIVSFIPNDDAFNWEFWKTMAMRIYAASGGKSFAVFQQWSQRNPFYDPTHGPAEDRQCWKEVCGSPPDRTGVEVLKKLARQHGWRPGLYPYEPTYADEGGYISPAKRTEVRKIVREFLDNIISPKRNPFSEAPYFNEWQERRTKMVRLGITIEHNKKLKRRDPLLEWQYEHDKHILDEKFVPPPIVCALEAVTGIGKTTIIIEEIVSWLHEHGELTPIIYAVVTHQLAEEIKEKFTKLGFDAQILRGYLASDPDHPINKRRLAENPDIDKKNLIPLCGMPRRVLLAMDTKQRIAETCCKRGKKVCPKYSTCAYRMQFAHYLKSGTWPDVWIVASDMLFHAHIAFDKAKAVIIDESFYQKGLLDPFDIELRDLKDEQKVVYVGEHNSELRAKRGWLFNVLQHQRNRFGGVETEHLHEHVDIRECKEAILLEWNEVSRISKELGLYPGMPEKLFAHAAEKKELIKAIKLAQIMIAVWEEIRWLLLHPEVQVSGRLQLGSGMLRWQGIAPIRKPFESLPTLLADAVMPNRSILEVYHPQIELAAKINAKSSPHTVLEQVLHAPTSSRKLNKKLNLEAVWRYIIQEWILIGRKSTLVICQKKVEVWLRQKGLPANVFIEHYNNVAGKDRYKDVALGIFIGRPAPGPYEIEKIAAALFGEQQDTVPAPKDRNAFVWYPAVEAGILLASGDGIKTTVDRHPAKMAEAVRWSVTDGELINAIGRLRLINRGPDNPVTAKLLFDNALPITVDKVVPWSTPTRAIETSLDGWSAEHHTVLHQLAPKQFKTLSAARVALKDGGLRPPGFVPVNFQVAGTGKNHRPGRAHTVYFDLNLIPNPERWLEGRYGRRLIFPGGPETR